jgi:hypothetical protein
MPIYIFDNSAPQNFRIPAFQGINLHGRIAGEEIKDGWGGILKT